VFEYPNPNQNKNTLRTALPHIYFLVRPCVLHCTSIPRALFAARRVVAVTGWLM